MGDAESWDMLDEYRPETACERCHHEFDTRQERVEHEQRGQRGLLTLCPCGDACYDPVRDDLDVQDALLDSLTEGWRSWR